MSLVNEPMGDFERNARTVLEASVSRIDARTRSRLNQARQAAVEMAGARHRPKWRSYTLMPAAGVAAAALVALMIWHREPAMHEPPILEGRTPAVEDIDLLADTEGLDLVEGWDSPGFYEWAADQTDASLQSDG
jgi:hypothetical protein